MDKIRIRGGRPLRGTIPVGGAKNAALPLMAASLPFYSAALAQGRHKEDTAALFAVLQQMAPGPEETA